MDEFIWLVTTGDGEDGNEWAVEGVFNNLEAAFKFRRGYQQPRYREDGSVYRFLCDIERWPLNPVYVPAPNQCRGSFCYGASE